MTARAEARNGGLRAARRSLRVGVATVFHESNGFVARRTGLEAFRILERDELLSLSGTQTVVGGFLSGLERNGMVAVPILWAWATPSGVLRRSTLDALAHLLAERLPDDLDALLLELHGSMGVDDGRAADAELAEVAAGSLQGRPLVLVTDPHANLAGRVVQQASAVLAYQTNPHVDMARCGAKAVSVLSRLLEVGRRPAVASMRVPVLAPAIAQGTADEPLRSLVDLAAEIDASPQVLCASLCFGYCYADVPEAGAHAVVVAQDERIAQTQARRLAAAVWQRRAEFKRALLSVPEAVGRVAKTPGLTVLVDAGDNVGGGASGSQTAIARELHRAGGFTAAATVCDPAVVQAARSSGVGGHVVVRLGTPPWEITARVAGLCEGRFVNRGPLSAGVPFDMGPTAVLTLDELTLVVQTHPVMANDQEMFASVGIDLDAVQAVALKGAAAVRAGWQDRATVFLEVDSPGETPSRLDHLDYLRVERPVWPLDDCEARSSLAGWGEPL